jgi:hypothetical protein
VSNITVKYKLKGRFVQRCADVVNYYYSMLFSYGLTTSDNIVTLKGAPTTGTFVSGSGANGFLFDLEGSFEIPASTPFVWLGITISNYNNTNTGSPSVSEFEIDIDESCFVRFESVTIYRTTESKVCLVHEAFAKISEVITGQKDCFKSNYFGAGNSQPRIYDSTGCQRFVSVTNGINIRSMLQKDGSLYPINISFSQLYKMLDAVFCLGMRFEYDESEGHWFVRVEPREFFYDTTDFLQFDDVSNITLRASLDNYYSNIKSGYKKWQLNEGQPNGLDEFNTNRSYTVLNKNANKQLDISCDAIAGGYPIEFTRRHSFDVQTTSDYETDNDIFIICLNRIQVVSDGVTYPIGTTNERNELFVSVDNLISPETAYNLMISPSRNMHRWSRFLKCSLYKNDVPVIKFTSGEGNYQMASQYSSGYCETTCEIEEPMDFSQDHNCFDGDALISPEVIEFEIPLNFSIFMDILANANKAIRVNCSNSVSYKGFINIVNFKPNQAQGGTAKFTLTTVPVKEGAAFDDGFDDGFDT